MDSLRKRDGVCHWVGEGEVLAEDECLVRFHHSTSEGEQPERGQDCEERGCFEWLHYFAMGMNVM